MIRVLLVDDHEVVRLGLRALFELESDIVVAGEANDAPSAEAAAAQLLPDVVVMDIRMGGDNDGIEACRAIKSANPAIAVLMLTSFGVEDAVLAALLAGASGFLLKNTGRPELLRCLRLVAAGHSLLDPAVTAGVTRKLVELVKNQGADELSVLSEREREVIELVARGMTNREIAANLVISETTARNHVSHILEKLGLTRRSEAAALAARLGLTGQRRHGA